MAEPYRDKKEQLQKIRAALLPGEQVAGVFDMKGGGTGFLGATTKRIIVRDKSFMRKMKADVSIPYSRIHSLAAEDESGPLTGRGYNASSEPVATTASGGLEFEFRGADKAHHATRMILRYLLA